MAATKSGGSSRSGGAANKSSGMADAAALKAHIKAGVPASCYLFTGAEDFLIRQYVREMKQFILEPETADMNFMQFEGRVKTRALLDATETYPVFAPRKLVLVRDSGFFKAARTSPSETMGDEDKKLWKSWFENVPEHCVLLFVESEVNKTVSLFKWIAKAGMTVEFTHPTDDMLIRWLMRLFGERGKSISPLTAGQLLHRAEEDMQSLYGEMEKLSQHAGSRADITDDDIRRMVMPSVRSRIFDLTDALAENRKSDALRLLDDMIVLREPEQKIFFMLVKQAGRMLQIARLLRAGVPRERVLDTLGLNPWSGKKLIAAASGIPYERLRQFVRDCAEVDVSVKSGTMRLRTGMEWLIAAL